MMALIVSSVRLDDYNYLGYKINTTEVETSIEERGCISYAVDDTPENVRQAIKIDVESATRGWDQVGDVENKMYLQKSQACWTVVGMIIVETKEVIYVNKTILDDLNDKLYSFKLDRWDTKEKLAIPVYYCSTDVKRKESCVCLSDTLKTCYYKICDDTSSGNYGRCTNGIWILV